MITFDDKEAAILLGLVEEYMDDLKVNASKLRELAKTSPEMAESIKEMIHNIAPLYEKLMKHNNPEGLS